MSRDGNTAAQSVDSSETRGWLNAGARVIRVLLSDPKVRSDIDTLARHVDPDEAPGLVRSVLWTDTGVTATVLAIAPNVVNAAIEAAREVGSQTRRLPPALVNATVEQLLSKIRYRQLGVATGQGVAALIAWLRARRAQPNDAWTQWSQGVSEALQEAGIEPSEAMELPLETFATRLERAVRENPAGVERATVVIRRVMDRHPDLVAALRGIQVEEER
jgi:hypothetical protein